MKVNQCMTRDPQVAAPEESLREAAVTMARIDCGFLPIAEDDRLIGIVTDRDIAVRGVGQGMSPDTALRRIMSGEVLYCFDDQEAEDVLDNMSDLQVRRLPVVDRNKRLVGVVSITDLADQEEKHAGEALRDIARPSALHSQEVTARG